MENGLSNSVIISAVIKSKPDKNGNVFFAEPHTLTNKFGLKEVKKVKNSLQIKWNFEFEDSPKVITRFVDQTSNFDQIKTREITKDSCTLEIDACKDLKLFVMGKIS